MSVRHARAFLVCVTASLCCFSLSACLNKTAGGSINNPDYRRAPQPSPDIVRAQRDIEPTRIAVEDADEELLYGAVRVALTERFQRLTHDDPLARFAETPQFDILDTGSPTPPRSKVSVRVLSGSPPVLEVTALRIEATGLRGTILSGREVPYNWTLIGQRPQIETEVADLIIHTYRTADPATLRLSATSASPATTTPTDPSSTGRSLPGVRPGTPTRGTTILNPARSAPRIQPLRQPSTTPARTAPARTPSRPGQR